MYVYYLFILVATRETIELKSYIIFPGEYPENFRIHCTCVVIIFTHNHSKYMLCLVLQQYVTYPNDCAYFLPAPFLFNRSYGIWLDTQVDMLNSKEATEKTFEFVLHSFDGLMYHIVAQSSESPLTVSIAILIKF